MRATIEPIKIPLYRDNPDKWAIIFHTTHGREEFGSYRTKAAAKTDAKTHNIMIERT